jgi:hypothetical protein
MISKGQPQGYPRPNTRYPELRSRRFEKNRKRGEKTNPRDGAATGRVLHPQLRASTDPPHPHPHRQTTQEQEGRHDVAVKRLSAERVAQDVQYAPGIEVREQGRVRGRRPQERDRGGGGGGGRERTERGEGMQALGGDRGLLLLQEQIDGQSQARHRNRHPYARGHPCSQSWHIADGCVGAGLGLGRAYEERIGRTERASDQARERETGAPDRQGGAGGRAGGGRPPGGAVTPGDAKLDFRVCPSLPEASPSPAVLSWQGHTTVPQG